MKHKKIVFLLSSVLFAGAVIGQGVQSFPDVKPFNWFYSYVEEIKDWGIVSGNDDGTFAPERNINRAEFSKMISLYDNRVDEKIDTAVEAIALAEEIEEALEEGQEDNEDLFVLSQPIYLQRYQQEPEACPDGWTDVSNGEFWRESGRRQFHRTCVTDQACRTVRMDSFETPPEACPTGWTAVENGDGLVWSEDARRRYQKHCYQCAQ